MAAGEASAELIGRVKRLIVDRLRLEMEPAAIEDDAPLFGAGLGLDSIDALELVVGLEQEFAIRIPDQDVGKRVLASARAIARYVVETGKH
jgi:acyl carrier protein